MSEVDRKLDAIREIKTSQEAAEASVKALTEMINMTTAVLGLVVPLASDLLRVLTKVLMPYLKKTIDKNLDNEPDKARLDLIKFSVNLDRVTRTVLVLSRFGLRLLPLALILLTLLLYTFLVYPVIPQSLGGGKPSQARLVVDVEKIPQDDSNLRDIFPQSVIDKRPAGVPLSIPTKPRVGPRASSPSSIRPSMPTTSGIIQVRYLLSTTML
jgi:hypothetical protein